MEPYMCMPNSIVHTSEGLLMKPHELFSQMQLKERNKIFDSLSLADTPKWLTDTTKSNELSFNSPKSQFACYQLLCIPLHLRDQGARPGTEDLDGMLKEPWHLFSCISKKMISGLTHFPHLNFLTLFPRGHRDLDCKSNRHLVHKIKVCS